MDAIGRYQVLSEVARGGMGAVFRALGPDGRPVALKLLLAGREATAMQRRRFATEAQALLRVRHPNVVALLDAGVHEGAPFLALEWVEGEALAARLAREGPLEPRAAAELVRRLAVALEHCHARGVVHRDLSPGNVLLRAGSAEPLLTDFGLARDVSGPGGTLHTRTGQFLGTPGFWAPEQVRGERQAIGPRTDVYGLGALLYALLTGRRAHQGETLVELLATIDRAPLSPRHHRPGVPAWLEAVCLAALQPDPARRPGSARELAGRLAVGLAAPRRPRAWIAAWAAGMVALSLVGLALAVPQAQPVADLVAAAPETTRAPAALGSEVRALLQAGEGALDFDRALVDLDRAVALEPDRFETWLARGLKKSRNGRSREALADLSQALALQPDDVGALLERAHAHALLEDWERSIQDLARVMELDPGRANAWVERGHVRLRRGDEAGARSDYDHALAIDPDLPTALNGRALLLADEDPAAARRDLDRSVELDPRLAITWTQRAALRALQKDPAGALADVACAVFLDPRVTEVYECRAQVRLTARDPEGALRDLNWLHASPEVPVARRDPAWQTMRDGLVRRLGARGEAILRAASLYTRARERVSSGDQPGAVALLDQVVALDPGLTAAWLDRSFLRETLGDLRGALQDHDRALQQDPRFHRARLSRADLRVRTGDHAGALADLEALAGLPIPPELEEAVRSIRARATTPSRWSADR